MICYVMLLCSVWFANLCEVIHVPVCKVVLLFYVMPCYFIQFYVILRYGALCYAMFCCYVILCLLLGYVAECYVM